MLGEKIDKQGQTFREEVTRINLNLKKLREFTANHIDEKKIQNTIFKMQSDMMNSIFRKKKEQVEFDELTYLRLNYINYKADIIDAIKNAEAMKFEEITDTKIQILSKAVKLKI